METDSVKAVRNHRNKERREKAVIKAAEREVHMREVQIQIEPFAYIAFQKLTISQSINQHGEAKMIMRIKDE